MTKKEVAKKFGEILYRNLKFKTSYSMIFEETKNCGIYKTEIVQNYLKSILKDKKNAFTISYDTMLKCEGYNEPGYSKDARFIKHKDRKEGWWD